MKRLLTSLFILSLAVSIEQSVSAQIPPAKQWDKTIGGNSYDVFGSLSQTGDGGYLLGGTSNSPISGEKTISAIQNNQDYWVVKLDSTGIKVWDKVLGGNDVDNLRKVLSTADGGSILAGSSRSGLGNSKSQTSFGMNDYWIVKLDSNGVKQWDKSFGGNSSDDFYDLIQTPDGGYLIGGSSYSGISGNKSQASKGTTDFWIVKLDSNGNKIWDKSFGGANDDILHSCALTSDGGFILGGESSSPISQDKSQASRGGMDFWVVKTDSVGNKIWDKTYGGNEHDILTQLKQTSDGGFILAGNSRSNQTGDKSQSSKGETDFWVIRLGSSGTKLWDRTYGGSNHDRCYSVCETISGGFVLGGESYSGNNGDKSQNLKGFSDYWLLMVDSNGNKIWNSSFGGNYANILQTIQIVPGGGYILGGTSDSNASGDKSEWSRGGFDYWIVKLAPEVLGTEEMIASEMNLYPNPTNGIINLELNFQKTTQVTVYNTLGQLVFTKNVVKTPNEEHIQIDLKKQPKGVYTIQVLSENQVYTNKVGLQ